MLCSSIKLKIKCFNTKFKIKVFNKNKIKGHSQRIFEVFVEDKNIYE